MATTTIHRRIQFARQFMHDAVDSKIIDENPFCKVKTQKSSVKVNEFVPCFSPEGDTCLTVCVSHRTWKLTPRPSKARRTTHELIGRFRGCVCVC